MRRQLHWMALVASVALAAAGTARAATWSAGAVLGDGDVLGTSIGARARLLQPLTPALSLGVQAVTHRFESQPIPLYVIPYGPDPGRPLGFPTADRFLLVSAGPVLRLSTTHGATRGQLLIGPTVDWYGEQLLYNGATGRAYWRSAVAGMDLSAGFERASGWGPSLEVGWHLSSAAPEDNGASRNFFHVSIGVTSG